MSLIENIIERSILKKEIIGFRTYDDSEKFWCGYVLNYNEYFIQIQHISKLGFYDGIFVERIGNIESIERDNYCNAIQFLVGKNQETYNQRKYMLPEGDEWQYEFLEVNNLRGSFLSFGVNGGVITGFLRDYDGENILFNNVGNTGEDNGLSYSKLSDIRLIQIDDLENKKREDLYNWRKLQHLF